MRGRGRAETVFERGRVVAARARAPDTDKRRPKGERVGHARIYAPPRASGISHEAVQVFAGRAGGRRPGGATPRRSGTRLKYDEDDDLDSGDNPGRVTDASEFDRIPPPRKIGSPGSNGALTKAQMKQGHPRGPELFEQFNIGRATNKRPTEFRVDQVCQNFDPKKFNFTKADLKEVLFSFTSSTSGRSRRPSIFEKDAAVDESPTVVSPSAAPAGTCCCARG